MKMVSHGKFSDIKTLSPVLCLFSHYELNSSLGMDVTLNGKKNSKENRDRNILHLEMVNFTLQLASDRKKKQYLLICNPFCNRSRESQKKNICSLVRVSHPTMHAESVGKF